jgi:hypothetical protein
VHVPHVLSHRKATCLLSLLLFVAQSLFLPLLFVCYSLQHYFFSFFSNNSINLFFFIFPFILQYSILFLLTSFLISFINNPFHQQKPLQFSSTIIYPFACVEFSLILMAITLHNHKTLSFMALYYTFSFLLLLLFLASASDSQSHHDFSIMDSQFDSFYSDYTPPEPHPPSLMCQDGLKGVGSLNT